jgi:thiamine-monophosphate kinase
MAGIRGRGNPGKLSVVAEFELIEQLQALIGAPVQSPFGTPAIGIGDDAAVFDLPAGRQLVVCTDTLVAGVHFPENTPPAAIGHKALAVNLSDLAAMGAEPAWFFMALTLPAIESAWVESFADGMARLAANSAVALAGGDVTSGPLSICITAVGFVPPGKALTRGGARPGDRIAISGKSGVAAHALEQIARGETPAPGSLEALNYPAPRLELGRGLRGLATSCIDLSDGLAADLGHVLRQSGAGAEIELGRLPCPESLAVLEPAQRWQLQAAGGDDYELCFTVPPGCEKELDALSARTGVEITLIGTVREAGQGLVWLQPDGARWEPPFSGYEHFSGEGAA